MSKSFKKVIACLLAVLMLAFSTPFTAFAWTEADRSNPNLTLQFGVITDENSTQGTWVASGNASGAPKQIAAKQNLSISGASALGGPILEPTGSYDPATGKYSVTSLTLEGSDIWTSPEFDAAQEDDEFDWDSYALKSVGEMAPSYELNGGDSTYTLQDGDLFTVTVCVDNVDTVKILMTAIAYSDNIEPAGIYRAGKNNNRKTYISTLSKKATSGVEEEVGFDVPYDPACCANNYDKFNGGVLDPSGITEGDDGQSYMKLDNSAKDAGADVTSFSEDVAANMANSDGSLGNAYEDKAPMETFVFMLKDASKPIEFWLYDTDNTKLMAYMGYAFASCKEEGTTAKYTTYAKNTFVSTGVYDDNLTNPGSYHGYFYGHNMNTNETLGPSTPSDPCAGGHDFSVEVEAAQAATCTTAAKTALMKCSRCDATQGGETVGEPLGHAMDGGVITKAPTCTTKGVKTYTCTRGCGYSTTEDIDESDHTPADAITGVIAATCTSDGYTGDLLCKDCGYEIEKGQTITKLGHDPSVELEAAQAATCTTAAKTALMKCSRCDYTEGGETVGEPLGHTYDAGVITTAPDCIHKGVKTYTCTACAEGTTGHSYTEEVNETGIHTPGPVEIEAGVDPTYIEDGYHFEVTHCTVCGVETSREQITDVATTCEHENAYRVGAAAATCTADGSTGSLYCPDCDRTLESATKIDKLGHIYDAGVQTKAPNCTEEGIMTYTCTREGCTDAEEGHSYTEAIKETGHTAKDTRDNVKAAKCDEKGYTGDLYCKTCGALMEAGEDIEEIPHTPVSADNAVAPTPANDGNEADVVCDVCGALITKGQVIPALGVTLTIGNACENYGDVTGANYGANNVAYGKGVTLTATPVEGATFGGWVIDGKVVSTSATYKVTPVADMTITPIFTDASANKITVVFLDQYNNIVAAYNEVTVEEFQAEMAKGIPTAPTYIGYTFKSWSKTDAEILALDSSETIVASYTADKAEGYTVTTDATLALPEGVENGSIPYDTRVTVSAEGATSWTVGDAVVAYGDTYSFYVGSDITVQPNFDAVTAVPTVTMVNVSQVQAGAPGLEFLATATIAAGYVQTDHGFVYGKAASEAELKLENVGSTIVASGTAVKKASLGKDGCAQFALSYGIKSMSGTATAVAYVTYTAADGSGVTTIYTPVATFTY